MHVNKKVLFEFINVKTAGTDVVDLDILVQAQGGDSI